MSFGKRVQMNNINVYDSSSDSVLKADEYVCEFCKVHFYASKKPTVSPCCRRKITGSTQTVEEKERNRRKIIEAQAMTMPLYNNTQAVAHIAKSAGWTTDELANIIKTSENVALQIVKSYYQHVVSFQKLQNALKKAGYKLYAKDASGDEFELKL